MATNLDGINGLASAIEVNLSVNENDLLDSIKAQGDLVRKLKADKAPEQQVS
jgi:hypothetical protein